MDILYVLGRGSEWEDNEIRYSLRSVEKHLRDVDKVWIIGQCPDFLTNVNHILMEDESLCKETNIYKKILRGCQENELSEDFLFMNDDHFFNHDYSTINFPYYYKGDILTVVRKKRQYNNYGKYCDKTMRILHSLGHPTKYFDVHTPIIYNKRKFIDVMTKYDWSSRIGMIVKSLYANSLRIDGEESNDCKINLFYTEDVFEDLIKNEKIWSVGAVAAGKELKNVMDKMYPNKSKWEK